MTPIWPSATCDAQGEQVAGVVLASGMSERFGSANKLLVPVGGRPLVLGVVEAYLDAGLNPVTVVTGFQGENIASVLASLPIRIVVNPEFKEGQSRALIRGVQSVERMAAAVIGVGDQPLLTAEVIRRLVEVHRTARAPVVVPRYGGHRGNPVLFDHRVFPELIEVRGDQGGRSVIENHANDVAWIDVEDVHLGMDIDSLDDYRDLRLRTRHNFP